MSPTQHYRLRNRVDFFAVIGWVFGGFFGVFFRFFYSFFHGCGKNSLVLFLLLLSIIGKLINHNCSVFIIKKTAKKNSPKNHTNTQKS